jgi:hypothetical protein
MSQRAVGKAQLEPGQVLQTANGKAEMLLTPGVYVRIDDNSSVRMVSPSLTNTVVAIDSGRADVEVDQLYKQNHIVIDQNGGQTLLLNGGVYEFNASQHTMQVFDGKAAVFEGGPQSSMSANEPTALSNGKPVTVKEGHELALNSGPSKPASFDKKQQETGDELYNWSSLRSEYLGDANINLGYAYGSAPGFYPGWYWDAGLYGYTWLPGGGPFFSPFGFGFYSPAYLYGGGPVYGRYGYGYRSGLAYGGNYERGAVAMHSNVAGGFGGGGFHGGGGGGGRR